MKLVQHVPDGPASIGPYSPAAIYRGVVYVSGQLPQLPDGTFSDADIGTQTRITLGNLKRVLEEAGSSLDRVMQTTVYLVDLNEFPVMNAAYAEVFDAHKPARATVQVAGLVRGVGVEISAVAAAAESPAGVDRSVGPSG